MENGDPARRLRVALDLYETGVGMTRARLRREHPDASNDEIELARHGVSLIAGRGFSRGRDLEEALNALVPPA